MPRLSHPYRVKSPEGPREYWRDFTHKKMREDVFRHLFSSYLNINGKLLKMSIQKYAITERISFLKLIQPNTTNIIIESYGLLYYYVAIKKNKAHFR